MKKKSEKDSDLLTLKECARLLGIHKVTLGRLCANDKIPHKKLGSRYVFSKERVLEFIRE